MTETILEYKPGAAALLAPTQSESLDVDLEKQSESSTESDGSSTVATTVSSQDSCRRRSPKNARSGQNSSFGENNFDEVGQKRVLLCIPGRGSDELKAACITSSKTDQCMFTALHTSLYSARRRLLHWLTLQRITGVTFAEVRISLLALALLIDQFYIYWRNNLSILPDGIGKLPPAEATDYLISRDTSPPLLLSALHHFIEHPSHAPTGTFHLDRMPKKLGPLPKVSKDGSPATGYGLQVQESICWAKALIVEICIALAALIFAIVWCSIHASDLQDGFTVAGVVLAYGTLTLAAIQGVAQQRAIRARFMV